MTGEIPVVLFTYARPAHLRLVLESLRAAGIPLLYVYADGAKNDLDQVQVKEVREQVREIAWCKVHLVERTQNLGLGRNVLDGVTAMAATFEAFIVWEDDLICVPGTYDWLVAALRHYGGDSRVMSVTAWTHPRVIPETAANEPYFDGRAECWVWGTWARAWQGMEKETALEKLAAVVKTGRSADAYGADLPVMAKDERQRNIWAVRWLYHHLQHRGLCLRPPWSMVEHIGFDAAATNAAGATAWANPPLQAGPNIPAHWPEPRENPECRSLWQKANPGRWERWWRRLTFSTEGR